MYEPGNTFVLAERNSTLDLLCLLYACVWHDIAVQVRYTLRSVQLLVYFKSTVISVCLVMLTLLYAADHLALSLRKKRYEGR